MLTELRRDNGSWQRLVDQWTQECVNYGESFDGYAADTIPVLREIIENPEPEAGVFATEDGADFSSVCQLNRTTIPGYTGYVLRMRLLTVSPHFDFGNFEVGDYATVIVKAVAGAIQISNDKRLEAPHIRLHLRSPADRAFFASMGMALDGKGVFDSVKLVGSWLFITKK